MLTSYSVTIRREEQCERDVAAICCWLRRKHDAICASVFVESSNSEECVLNEQRTTLSTRLSVCLLFVFHVRAISHVVCDFRVDTSRSCVLVTSCEWSPLTSCCRRQSECSVVKRLSTIGTSQQRHFPRSSRACVK